MSQNTKNSRSSLPLWWSGVISVILGVAAIQLAGFQLSSLQVSEISGKKESAALTAVISNPLPVSRQLRSSRNRPGVHGRLNNFRNGCDGNSSVLCFEPHTLPYRHFGHQLFIPFGSTKNFWIDFIISALPVRAGPAA